MSQGPENQVSVLLVVVVWLQFRLQIVVESSGSTPKATNRTHVYSLPISSLQNGGA
jgi:hypothetical protein